VRICDHELILENVDLGDVGGLIRPDNGLVSSGQGFNDDLARRNVVKFKFALIFDFFHGNIVNIDRAAQGPGHQFTAVVFPNHACYGVVIVDGFDPGFLPLAPLRVEVVQVKPVEISQNNAVSGGVESGAAEFPAFIVVGVVESLQ
jgi:hypothetical protein